MKTNNHAAFCFVHKYMGDQFDAHVLCSLLTILVKELWREW